MTLATGTAERDAAAAMVRGRRGTLGGDKGYDAKEFVRRMRAFGLTPAATRCALTAEIGTHHTIACE